MTSGRAVPHPLLKRPLPFFTALVALAILAWYFWPRSEVGPVVPNRPESQALSAASPSTTSNPNSKPSPPASAEVSHLADTLNSPSTDIHADLRVVGDILTTFRTNFPHDGNPVGDNAEITATLTGRNQLHLALIPPGHAAINAQHELCDRWGTPFFFHAESGTRMAIRSAGPDKKMWTADDVVLPP